MSSRRPCRPPAGGTDAPVRVVAVSGAHAVLAAQLATRLSDAERVRATGIRAGGARVDFVVAHAVLREQLGLVLGCAPAEVPLRATSTGKPVLDGGAGPELSVTHTDGLVLVAWHPTLPVGIDAERAERVVAPALIDRVGTPAERAALAALGGASRAVALLRLWVRKEAVAKADGRGLALALSDLEVLGGRPLAADPPAPDPEPLRVELGAGCEVGGGVGWVRDLDVGPEHVAAVATIGGAVEVSVRPWAGLDR